MDFEEDTYSSIFLSLKHPVRRKIVRMLNEAPSTYTQILERLGVETGFLNYHLENLKGLVTKGENDRYRLSEFGEAALALIAGVEEPVKRRSNGSKILGLKINPTNIVLTIAAILIVSNIFWAYTYQDQLNQITNLKVDNMKLLSSLGELNSSHTEISNKYEKAQNLLDQIIYLRGAALTDRYTANGSGFVRSFSSEGGGGVLTSITTYRIYSLVNESELEIQFTADRSIPTGAYVTLSVALEDQTLAYAENQSFFEFYRYIWTVDSTANGTFTVRLPLSGHLLFHVYAPQNVPEEAYEKTSEYSKIFTLPFTITFRIWHQGEYISFLVYPLGPLA